MNGQDPSISNSIDIAFSVPFVHRLRSTRDVFGPDADVLLDLLIPSGPAPAKVQVWLDADVARALPELGTRCLRLLRSRPEQLSLASHQPDAAPEDCVRQIPGGEACKNDPRIVDSILEQMNADNLDRRSYVIVIGGGAVLDAVGYAAAIAHRGIRLIRLPTTTLAQADSGVGVKNAVNRFGKKNWVGTFAVPWAVINDVGLLSTLPDRDFRCGYAEALKVFLLKSPLWFSRLCENASRIRQRDMTAAVPVIAASATFHLDHITSAGGDPFESREARPLDFGHWSAHKLESISGFRIRHGEAVAMGVAVDVVYSSIIHGLPRADALTALTCLQDLGLSFTHPLLTERMGELFDGLEEFRQHLGGRLTLTMLKSVGSPIDVHTIDLAAMREAIHQVVRLSAHVS